MRSRFFPVLATAVLAVSLLGPVTAVADEDAVTEPEVTGPEQASEVLDQAQQVFEDRSPTAARRLLARGGGDATMALNQLVRVRDELSPSDRRQADALLARPTDGADDPEGDGYTVPEAPPVCGDTVCIHYVTSTKDAPDLTDGDDAGTVPDSVDQALATAEDINDTYAAAGYRRPDSDEALDGDGRVDIYLANVGSQGFYGYCTTDQRGTTFNRWAYCVIDNDYAERAFSSLSPEENRQVTLAHEYFHAVQYAYDAFGDRWFMEATATWVEDEVFDRINDNRQYLPYGQLRRPGVSLDLFDVDGNHYGNWLFFRRLTERFPAETGTLPTLVLRMWEQASARAGDPDLGSTAAIQKVLAGRRSSFTREYAGFAAANRRPAAKYLEGRSYRASPVTRRRLGPRDRRTVSPRLDHLTHRSYRFIPDGTRRRDWRLRLDLDMPSARSAPAARLLVYPTRGEVSERSIRLARSGVGRVTLGFSQRRVDRVELVLVNAGRRSRDDGLRTVVNARTYRR